MAKQAIAYTPHMTTAYHPQISRTSPISSVLHRILSSHMATPKNLFAGKICSCHLPERFMAASHEHRPGHALDRAVTNQSYKIVSPALYPSIKQLN
jgi:hypothetical protein